MMPRWALAAALCLLAPAAHAADSVDPRRYAALAQADARLATIAERLQSANAALCRQHMPVTGMILHSRDQYAGVPEGWFGNGPVEVQQVLGGSPAALADLLPGDAVEEVNDRDVSGLPAELGRPRRDTVFAYMAEQPADLPLFLTVRRDGQDFPVVLPARPGCRAMVEVLTGEVNLARADGRVIQISGDFVTGLSEPDLAVLLAHELAHSALEHRRRLAEAGVEQGLAGLFGRNGRLARQAEIEADLLSAHILANAGYDPRSAVLFWQSEQGHRAGGGAFRSPVYPSPDARARLIEQEIDGHLRAAGLPSVPGHLLDRRDRPLEQDLTRQTARE